MAPPRRRYTEPRKNRLRLDSLCTNERMPVDFLNFQHLYYFWIVAREGGISRASEVLDLSPSTISTQIGQLEKALEVKLFRN